MIVNDAFLRCIDHRPWPMPNRSWLWRQRWDRVLLLHWRVDAARLAPFVPRGLSLDVHEGSAWVSLVPFWMRGVRPRGLFAVPPISNFVELNVRTYVTAHDRPGVYFLRIDAGSPWSAWLGRMLSPLPYQFSKLTFVRHGAGTSFRSPNLTVHFDAGQAFEERTPRDLWLTERYCMYADPRGRLVRADVHHAPWPLTRARVRVEHNRALAHLGIEHPLRPDAIHLSAGVEMVGFSAEEVAR